ncbi:hypothetical protein TSAR_013719 [Trichomalopsis sarcophagae]|uniref:Uncharacterized protein n=1 Tax=Trichomalopsis sarcophagae TaxID=543379 RepID=A0A232FB77_9HYME|nr:hypothetical protein TSAR_013719 [Trichomalopsis sarcophagae]
MAVSISIKIEYIISKAEGLLNSDKLTVTSGFKGNEGLRLSDKPRDFTGTSHCTLIAGKPIFMAEQCIDL